MSNRNRFLVGSMTLMIWASGLIAPDFFVSVGQAAKPSSGASTPTVVEIVGNLANTNSPTVIYTVPASHRLTITDIVSFNCSNGTYYRNASIVTSVGGTAVNGVSRISYQTGIEFQAGDTLSIAFCGSGGYELRGYLEAL